jgi:hypothetical protein
MKKGIVVKPILEKDYAERYQADLIDMQSQSDGIFKWILVVQVLKIYFYKKFV